MTRKQHPAASYELDYKLTHNRLRKGHQFTIEFGLTATTRRANNKRPLLLPLRAEEYATPNREHPELSRSG